MRRYLLKCYIVLLTQIVIITGVQPNNNSLNESRHPRGRIVKLYSGLKPEPITCNIEGFLADPINCSIFYRCIKASRGKYTIVKFQCSPGTVYDPEIETCNHPQNTKRPECRSSRPFQYATAPVEQINDNDIEPGVQEIPSPITTRKPIYDKQTGTISELRNKPSHLPALIPVAIQDSEYEAYGPTNQVQSTIKAQTNEISKTTELQRPMSSTVSTTKYQWTPPPDQNRSTSSITAARLGSECVHDGFMGDIEDCRKFYRCINDQRGGFKKIEFMCSESTIWDDDIQSCNHPWAVRHRRCGRDTSSRDFISKHEEYYSEKNNSFIEKEVYSKELNKTEKPVKVDLPLSTSNQINYGDQINFNEKNVWNNENNVTDIMTNNQEKQINYPIREKETDYITQSYETITKTSSYIKDEVKPDTSTNPSTYQAINNTCTESGFMGDPQDCRKFFRCVENGRGTYIRHEFQCSEGTAWDKNIESCNHVWMVKECRERDISNSFTSKRYDSENIYTTSSNIIKDDIASINNGYSHQNVNMQHILRPTTVLPVVTQILNESSKLNGGQVICNSVGFMGNQNNCKIFYRCIENSNGGFTKFEYMCGEGTAWDPSIEACNHAQLVKHCGDNVNENQTKISTSSTESTIKTTVLFVQTTVQSGDNNFVNDVSYVPTYLKETTVKSLTTSQVLVNVENKCEESGFMADSYDCRKFYRCIDNGNGDFTRFEYLCGDGTLWDKNINACNHFWAVQSCGSEHSKNESTFLSSPENYDNLYYNHTNNINEDPIRSTESTTVVNLSNLSNMTATSSKKINACLNSGFIGDELDCKKFYRCVSNGDGTFKQYEFSCGDGTVWDPEIEACNHAWAVKNCGGSSNSQNEVSTTRSTTTMIIPNDEFNSGYTTLSYNHTKLPVQNTIDLSSIKVPGSDKGLQCQTVGFMADENDCKRFYRCVENGLGGFDRFEFSCGEGTVWDSNIQACNHAASVKNCGTVNYNTTTSSLIVITTQSTAAVSVEADKNVIGHSETEPTTTIKTSYANNTCTSDGFYADANDCKKFYRCIINKQGGFFKYEFSCGEGTVWDQNIQACNHVSIDNMNCKSSTANPITTGQSSVIPPGSTESYTISLEGNSTQENSDYVPDMGNTCVAEGFYPNLKDCKKFFRCVNNGKGYIRYDFTCGEGTIWVQAIQACDHESDNSTCSTETVNEVYVSTTTRTTASQINTSHSETPNKTVESETSSISTKEETKTTEAIMTTRSSTLTPEKTPIKEDALGIAKCESEGYFGNKEDCQKFYRCVNDGKGHFIKYDYICGDGTIWDQDILTCNHPRDVINRSCDNGSADASSTANTQSSIESTTSASSSTQSSSTPSISTQAATTSMFTQTAMSTKEESKTTEAIMTTTSSTLTPEKTPIKEDALNVAKCESEGYFGNKEDCQKFHRCVDDGKGHFVKYDYICGDGTIWDQDILTCNHPRDVINRSCDNGSATAPSTANTESFAQSTTSAYSSTQSSSTQTVTTSMLIQTATSSMSTRPETSSISTEEQTKTTEAIMTTKSSTLTPETTPIKEDALNVSECESEGYFGNKKDCQKFYRCVDDGKGHFIKYDYICGDGAIWDQDILTCNHPKDVINRSCDKGTSNASSTGNTEASIESTTSASSFTQSSSTPLISTQTATSLSTQTVTSSIQTATQSTSTHPTTSSNEGSSQETPICSGEGTSTNPENQNITCNHAGYFANPSDCKKFYRCVDWDGDGRRFSVFHFVCGEGTIWDPALNTCNYEESVYPPRNCSATQAQINDSSQTTTTYQTTRTEATTTLQPSSSEPTSTPSTSTEGQTTEQQSSTNQMSSSTATPTDTTSTTIIDTTSTTMTPTETSSTTSDQTTSEQSTTDITTAQSDKSTTTTVDTSTNENTSSTSDQTTTSEKTTTTMEATTSMTQPQTSTTLEQSSTEQSTTQTTVSATEETTLQGSTTAQQASTESSTEISNASSTTETSPTSTGSTTESTEATTQGTSTVKDCPDTDDDQYLYACPTSFKRHPKYCNLFYQCIENNDNHELKIATFNCPNGTIYDESKIQCIEESKAEKKCQGAIAKNRRIKRLNFYSKETISVSKNKYGCSEVGHYPFEKNEECSPAILKCQISKGGKVQGFVYRCPDNYMYWSVSRRCEPISKMTACKNSSNQWIGRSEIPIERKNIA